jgi:hypothetical protein
MRWLKRWVLQPARGETAMSKRLYSFSLEKLDENDSVPTVRGAESHDDGCF